ncbi:MAG: DUF3168 domain-containing protein [Mesorhizobium sp.]|nr:DUF3168 domain-containing protein [Mesorhizobium sp.]
MTSPAVELQKAIHATLSADAALSARLGGAQKIFDAAPNAAAFPYVSFGRTNAYDWSTGTEKGTEQLFTVHVWSKAKGKTEALEIMEQIRWLLEGADLALDGHRLVNLTFEFAEARYDDDLAVHHGLLRFRAVTEPV